MKDHAKLDEILKEGFCQMYGEMTFVVLKNSIFVKREIYWKKNIFSKKNTGNRFFLILALNLEEIYFEKIYIERLYQVPLFVVRQCLIF